MAKNLCRSILISFTLLVSHAVWANLYTTDLVDNTSIGYYGTDIAHDSHGHPGICYRDATNQTLKYAYHNGVNWATETADRRGRDDRGYYCSIIFDKADHPHIVYYTPTAGKIWHATKNNGAWEYYLVSRQNAGDILIQQTLRVTMAKDSAGNIGAAYYNSIDKDLMFGEWNGRTWTVTTVDSDGDVGRYPSLTYDSLDRPVISYVEYVDNSHATLWMATRDRNRWSAETVVDTNAPAFNSLQLDANDTPHVAYQSTDTDGIQTMNYTNKVGGRWNTAVTLQSGAARGASVGTFCKMVLGADGDAHIMYRYYFFSALFGSSNYLKMANLYNVMEQTPKQVSIQEDRLEFSVAPKLDYAAFAIAMTENQDLAYSYVKENFENRNSSLYSGILSQWSPMLMMQSPNDQNHRAVEDRLSVNWIAFDPDSNAKIRFYYRDADFQTIQIGDTFEEDRVNQAQLDTSALAPGSYFLEGRISDDDFQTYLGVGTLTQMEIPNRPAAAAPAAPPAAVPAPAPAAPPAVRPAAPEAPPVVPAADPAKPEVPPEPLRHNDPPKRPEPVGHDVPEEADTDNPGELVIQNSTDTDGDAVTYNFQICEDETCNTVVDQINNVAAGADGTTALNLADLSLFEGTYYWRVQASDSIDASDWTSSEVFTIPGLRATGTGDSSNATDGQGSASNAQAGGCSLVNQATPLNPLVWIFFILVSLPRFLIRCSLSRRQK